jgi:hypothetical protein
MTTHKFAQRVLTTFLSHELILMLVTVSCCRYYTEVTFPQKETYYFLHIYSLWHYAASRKVAGSNPDEVDFFKFT